MNTRNHIPKYHRGLTFIELLIALAILCLLTTFGIPSLSQAIERSESRALTSAIRTTLALSRTEAIASESTVSICGTQQSNRCVKTNFSQLVVFVDQNRNGEIDTSEKTLFIQDLNYSGALSLNASFGRDYIRFKKDGSSEQSGSFVYCNPKYPTLSSRMTLSMVGRIYMAKDRDNDGIIENTDGSPIRC